MRTALAQINPTVGDLSGNVDRMVRAAKEAHMRGAEVVVFPELSITGYPPRDLVEKPNFLDRSESELGRLALTVCEDAWNDRKFWKRRLYTRDPVEELFEAGGELLICINASPYHMGKREVRRGVYRAAARRYHKPVLYVNQVGGNDQLVF